MSSGAATAAELLAAAKASPVAVAAHDKQGWLALFARDHILEDPVGSRPVLGGVYDRRAGDRTNGPLSRFWDTFIAANDISFVVHGEYVDGSTVVRDVTITTVLPTGVSVIAPAHLRYEIVAENGELKIRRMGAHWEPLPVYRQLLRPTSAHLRGAMGSNNRMLRYLGLGGTIRFVGAVRSVGAKGKAAVRKLVARAARGGADAVAQLGGILPENLTKVIASGDTISATCTVAGAPAVLIVTLNRKTLTVVEARIFTTGPI